MATVLVRDLFDIFRDDGSGTSKRLGPGFLRYSVLFVANVIKMLMCPGVAVAFGSLFTSPKAAPMIAFTDN